MPLLSSKLSKPRKVEEEKPKSKEAPWRDGAFCDLFGGKCAGDSTRFERFYTEMDWCRGCGSGEVLSY